MEISGRKDCLILRRKQNEKKKKKRPFDPYPSLIPSSKPPGDL